MDVNRLTWIERKRQLATFADALIPNDEFVALAADIPVPMLRRRLRSLDFDWAALVVDVAKCDRWITGRDGTRAMTVTVEWPDGSRDVGSELVE